MVPRRRRAWPPIIITSDQPLPAQPHPRRQPHHILQGIH